MSRKTNAECAATATSTHGMPGKAVHINAHADGVRAEELPWELREDPDELDDEIERRKDELKRAKTAAVIHAVGLIAYIGAVLIACSIDGSSGWTMIILLTVAMLCMDRS